MKKPLLGAMGLLSLAVGVLALFVPLLPTTPFVLLSAYCLSRSWPRLHNWLLASRLFGKLIADWEREGAINRRAKISATVMMLALISVPVFFMAIPVFAVILAPLSCACVLAFIWTRPEPRARTQTGGNS